MSNLLEINPDKVELARPRCIHISDVALEAFSEHLAKVGMIPELPRTLRLADGRVAFDAGDLDLLSSGCSDDQGDALEAATRPGRWDGEANAIG